MRIIGKEISPCREYDNHILGELAALIDIGINSMILLGEAEETRGRNLFCELHHVEEVDRSRNIAGRMITKILAGHTSVFDILEVAFGRVLIPAVVILPHGILDVSEIETPLAGVAFFAVCARGILVACDDGRKVDAGDWTQLAVTP